MYAVRDKKTDILFAIGTWILEMAALYGVRYCHVREISQKVGLITIVYVFCVVFVLIKERNLTILGFGTEKTKRNAPIACGIIIATFFIRLFMSKSSFAVLLPLAIHMLVMTALREEILFRGIIQNYLIISQRNKFVFFAMGGLLFASSHIPLYSLNQPGIPLWLQLLFAFAGHFIFTGIAYWRKDITIPVALHFLMDFLLSA